MPALVGVPVGVPRSARPLLSAVGLLRDAADFSATSDVASVTATASATPHTKGAWVELIASTAADYEGLILIPGTVGANTVNTAILMDIGVGAAASEVVKIANVDTGYCTTITNRDNRTVLPFAIPKGSRVALRIQGTQVSETQLFTLVDALSPHPTHPLRSTAADTYGVNTATSVATSLIAPGSINTKGAWKEITASTTQPYRALLCCVGHQATTVQTAGVGLVDFGVGAAGSEVVVAPNITVFVSVNENIVGNRWRTIPIHVPAGTRISARFQASTATPLIAASVIGIPY